MTTLHIKAGMRKAELLPAVLLVFKTVRVGFPTARIVVHGGDLGADAMLAVREAARSVHAEFFYASVPMAHDAWIEKLLHEETEPFWICDTDIVFFGKVEDWSAPTFMGRFEPEFDEEWTQTRHVERLHSSLMYFNPGATRAALRCWMAKIPALITASCEFPLIRQTFIAAPYIERSGQVIYFYDVCAGMYHAIGGTRFTPEQDACFEHLHCASYVDLIRLKGLQDAHYAIYADFRVAKGMQLVQAEYYKSRKPKRSNRV